MVVLDYNPQRKLVTLIWWEPRESFSRRLQIYRIQLARLAGFLDYLSQLRL